MDLSSLFLLLIPKKKGLVLFTSWFGNKYIDNSKYVYEYMLSDPNCHPIWMTKRKDIYMDLRRANKPVEFFGSLRGILLQLRAQVVVSSVQYADYNTWLLKNTVFLDLGHGHPIKDPGMVLNDRYLKDVYIQISKRVNYFAIVSSLKSKEEYNVVPISKDHIYIGDYARNDVFDDPELRNGKNGVVASFKKGRKAIVYMPTHRSDGNKNMHMQDILPLDDIQKFCEDNNNVFIIKKHYYHRDETEDLLKYPNILDITQIDDIDPQVLLYQADVLISDYSACYIDYMLLKRPLIFFQYDINEFQNSERKLYYDFEKIDIAPVVYDKKTLIKVMKNVVSSEDVYLSNRMLFAKNNYFDNVGKQEGRKNASKVIMSLLKKYGK